MNALTRLALCSVVFAAPDVSGNAAAAEAVNAELQRLIDERDLVHLVDRIDRAVDARDWKLARGFFADRVRADFSSLSGQPEATISADDLIAGWAGNLKGNKTSLHLRTNHEVVIDGDRATVKSNGYAWNRMEGSGEPLWEVWGTYSAEMIRSHGGWVVDAFAFHKTHERGNDWVKITPGQ